MASACCRRELPSLRWHPPSASRPPWTTRGCARKHSVSDNQHDPCCSGLMRRDDSLLDTLCACGAGASCNVQEILAEQGKMGWGSTSLLTAEKLAAACVQMLTANDEGFRIVLRSGGGGGGFGRGRGRGRGRGGRGFGGGRGGGGGMEEASFHFWCLNAGVAFVPVAAEVTSTLSPQQTRGQIKPEWRCPCVARRGASSSPPAPSPRWMEWRESTQQHLSSCGLLDRV